jgi:hypothetical protein
MTADMPGSLAEALARFQAQLPDVEAGRTGHVDPRDQTKQGFDFGYADLADVSRVVLPRLGALGVAWCSKPAVRDDGKFGLEYALVHWPSGERDGGFYELPPVADLQQRGKLITYARRQALCAMTGIAPRHDEARSGRRRGGQSADADGDGTGKWLAGARQAAPNLATVRACELMIKESARKNQAGELTDQEAAELQGILRSRIKALSGAAAGEPSQAGTAQAPEARRQPEPGRRDPEDEPGSVSEMQLTMLHTAFADYGFGSSKEDKERKLQIAEQITGRALTGPHAGRTSKNLSLTEARTLIGKLEEYGRDWEKLSGYLDSLRGGKKDAA